jgi:DNA-binding HxlR family transcriptional regulator
MQHKTYTNFFLPVRDALDVISGKWRLQIIISVSSGNKRFTEIERSIPKMTSKVLAKELKDMEEHQLIKRAFNHEETVEYTLHPYAKTLRKAVDALRDWGVNHRKQILSNDATKSHTL